MSSPTSTTSTNSSGLATPSLLSPIGYRSNSCGYCKNKRDHSASRSYYASSKSLSAQFYEDLLCRGWRRSGTLLYKPDLKNSCCPHYTIRLDSQAFRATKDQRQAQNRFNRYILGDAYIKEAAKLYPKTKEEAARYKQEFDLCERVHESEREVLKAPPEPAHDFKVTLESDAFTEEKFLLYENYQRIVHKEAPEDITRQGLKRFLCSSPLQPTSQTIDGQPRKLGSYHQCYRLDGRLLAVAVLDLLPHAVSAVYFMYHESLHRWSPGKLSALREAALALEAGYRWYMMGFYIHSCPKMRYKADFHPQYLLDPETYAWHPLDDDLRRRLDARPYVSLSAERRAGIPAPSTADVAAVAASASSSDAAADAAASDSDSADVPIFARDMPGLMTRAELDAFALGRVALRLPGHRGECADLVVWEGSAVDDPGSVKGAVAELVAAVGPGLAGGMCVTF